MLDQKVVDELKEFGLGEYEAKIFLTLTIHGPLKVTKIAEGAGIPKSKAYEVVRTLQKKGLVENNCEQPKKYKATDLLYGLKSIIEQKAQAIDKLKNKTVSILQKIKQVPLDNKYEFWMSKGRKAFLKKISEMGARAKSYGWAITKDFSRSFLLDTEVIKARKRGVELRVLAIGKLNGLARSRASWVAANGVEMRAKQLAQQPRFCIVDGKEICIRVDDPADSEFIWTNYPALVNVMKYYFETLWEGAEKIKL